MGALGLASSRWEDVGEKRKETVSHSPGPRGRAPLTGGTERMRHARWAGWAQAAAAKATGKQCV